LPGSDDCFLEDGLDIGQSNDVCKGNFQMLDDGIGYYRIINALDLCVSEDRLFLVGLHVLDVQFFRLFEWLITVESNIPEQADGVGPWKAEASRFDLLLHLLTVLGLCLCFQRLELGNFILELLDSFFGGGFLH
jgi:hypothetical protein